MSAVALAETRTSVPPSTTRVAFTGRNGDFRRLVVRGALLELVTFGFYRFWLTTDIRRHLWSRTELDGDAFEYIGRGKELLLGFLIAMAVLGPVFLVNFLLGLEIERFKAFASLPLYLFLAAFGQFAAYRARRYRLTRTVWRGVRFWMTGSGWSYAWRSLLWGLLLFPTLGFAYPWRMAALERFKLRHTLYGKLSGRFEASGSQLFKRIWWVWLLGLLPWLLLAGGAVASGATRGNAAAGFAMLLGGILLLGLPFLHGIRRAREWVWWAGGIRFGDLAIACHLRSASLIGIYWKLIGLALLVVIVYGAIAAGLIFAIVKGHATAGDMTALILSKQLPVWSFAAFAATYLALLIVVGVLFRIYSLQRIWRRVVAACAVSNIDAAADVGAAGDVVSGFGEGLADGLDFGL